MDTNEVKVINPEDAPGKGRPKMFRPEYGPIAYELALLGHTNEEIAKVIGVSLSTFKTWLKLYFDFLTTLKAGKELADGRVAHALYKRAVGFEVDGEKLITVSIGDGCSKVERHTIKVYFPPDPGAAMNWLKNRQPALWRDKQDVSLSGEITVTLNLNGDSNPTDPIE